MSEWKAFGALKCRYTKDYQEYFDYEPGTYRYRYRLNFDDEPGQTYGGTFQDDAGRRRLKKRCFQERYQVTHG